MKPTDAPMTSSKPTPADILAAIGHAEAGDWIDPSKEPVCWCCVLDGPDGRRWGDGIAHTAAQAMAMAWLCAWAPGALCDGEVEEGSVPLDVPEEEGWEFELTPPEQSDLEEWEPEGHES